ncbi:CbiQ family ECF transporter T component [Jatrophihabitans endophyticus]|uniref:CbiQ family ECF transporter T component n=1 Tax=Jatrophihabitans endophyticus TaxID=1206085 RepID=UPI0019EB886C|nr:CbiQ family ECF transporter T component [Jatrophihabitans endophyticus]MBE7186830.1 energy-coupling factor transporter transmembrane protein EcfT [Jatrophihabitans endophyticus]
MSSGLQVTRLPRALHPMAWWVWAIGLATAASRTSDPLLLLLVLAVLGFVVSARRSAAPWARGFRYYLVAAFVIIAVRVVFRAVFTTGFSPRDHILFTLPRLPLPHWYAGVQIGGPVPLEACLSSAFDGLRLATLLCCVGAANVLANPKRALRVLPGALYELGVAVVVALTFAPQLVESGQRVRRARRLRAGHGRSGRVRGLRSLVVPVLEDALERSLHLAAGMDSRGYGRAGTATPVRQRATAALLLTGMVGLCFGVFGLLDTAGPHDFAVPAVAAGAALCVGGLAAGGRRVLRTAYRPDRWRGPEWVVAAGGVVCAAVLVAEGSYDSGAAALNPVLDPLRWPALPILPAVAILLAGLAALAAPPPVGRSRPPARVPERPAPERVPVGSAR